MVGAARLPVPNNVMLAGVVPAVPPIVALLAVTAPVIPSAPLSDRLSAWPVTAKLPNPAIAFAVPASVAAAPLMPPVLLQRRRGQRGTGDLVDAAGAGQVNRRTGLAERRARVQRDPARARHQRHGGRRDAAGPGQRDPARRGAGGPADRHAARRHRTFDAQGHVVRQAKRLAGHREATQCDDRVRRPVQVRRRAADPTAAPQRRRRNGRAGDLVDAPVLLRSTVAPVCPSAAPLFSAIPPMAADSVTSGAATLPASVMPPVVAVRSTLVVPVIVPGTLIDGAVRSAVAAPSVLVIVMVEPAPVESSDSVPVTVALPPSAMVPPVAVRPESALVPPIVPPNVMAPVPTLTVQALAACRRRIHRADEINRRVGRRQRVGGAQRHRGVVGLRPARGHEAVQRRRPGHRQARQRRRPAHRERPNVTAPVPAFTVSPNAPSTVLTKSTAAFAVASVSVPPSVTTLL